MRRLEQAERSQDQQQNVEEPAITGMFSRQQNTFDEPHTNSIQLPGLEDDADDEEEDKIQTLETFVREEPDEIDEMVWESNKRYRQRAREFNWNLLLGILHPVYMDQKIRTKNWCSDNSYDNFSGISTLADDTNAVGIEEDLVDQLQLSNMTRLNKARIIKGELMDRLKEHAALVEGWLEDFLWLSQRCQRIEHQSFITHWTELLIRIEQDQIGNSINEYNIDEALEDLVLEEVVDNGEEVDDGLIETDQVGGEDNMLAGGLNTVGVGAS
ncbi:hypothetical protein PtA15_6A756 [Puccinia triticina]|uniref:Uncharacterized protein n=1 Tax=Puccinia triticina TaxID=208348 RepID=A0ABY7CPR4_9BASI|nr:uncharacterized protein PtA15_6A756 [Puccinia triticina]WAQ86126.1 hypothetical protein PtA15_6A756 [Puccinia triticina]